MKKYIKYQLLVICSLALLCLVGCNSQLSEVSQTGFFFDTSITITLYERGGKPLLKEGSTPVSSEDLLAECFKTCARYEGLFSRTMEGSDIWTLNHAGGAIAELDPETVDLLSASLDMCRQTEGIFDITIAPVTNEWDFSSGKHLVPSPDRLDQLISHVDYRQLEIMDETHVRLKDPEAYIDLGASAKGYIADRLKDLLVSRGVESALLNLGGNLQCIGGRPDQKPFRLGIKKPFDEGGDILTAVSVRDMSLVTSGTYERCFEKDGVLYHHILDSSTGMPVDNGLTSVSILSESSLLADLFSTSCFLLGPERGLEFAEKQPGLEALFVDEAGNTSSTSGWPVE